MEDAATVDPDVARRVFVVHGRNQSARVAMFEFLRAVGLWPIEWSEAVELTGSASPYIGQALDAAFAHATAVVVLLTPDEIAYLRPDMADDPSDPECEAAPQARPNVLFEAGMALGRHPDRTVLVELGTMRAFSDVAGRHAIRLDGRPETRKQLAQRLATAGCSVNTSGTDWLSAGDFVVPAPPGGGLPLGRKVPAARGRSRVSLDLRYHSRSGSGRLELVNRGSEAVFDVNFELPPEAGNFWLHTDGDPALEFLPAGKSAMFVATRALGGGGRDHFMVKVTGRTADGEQVAEDLFLSLIG